jgi:hypothetical protein
MVVKTSSQITSGERCMLAALRKQGLNQSQLATALGRHRSTISQEFRRNSCQPGVIPGGAHLKRPRHGRAAELRLVVTDEGVLDTTLCAKYAAAFVRMARSSSSCLTCCRSSKFSCSSGVRCPWPRKASAPSFFAALTHRDARPRPRHPDSSRLRLRCAPVRSTVGPRLP